MYAQRRALGLSQGLNQSQGVSPQNHSPGILLNKSQGIASQAEFPTSELGLAVWNILKRYCCLLVGISGDSELLVAAGLSV